MSSSLDVCIYIYIWVELSNEKFMNGTRSMNLTIINPFGLIDSIYGSVLVIFDSLIFLINSVLF